MDKISVTITKNGTDYVAVVRSLTSFVLDEITKSVREGATVTIKLEDNSYEA